MTFEPRPGGRIFERTPAGEEHDWGEVLEWEPPRRLAYLWHLRQDRADATRVEITFAAADEDGTAVTIVHSGWERLGARGADLRERNQRGWGAAGCRTSRRSCDTSRRLSGAWTGGPDRRPDLRPRGRCRAAARAAWMAAMEPTATTAPRTRRRPAASPASPSPTCRSRPPRPPLPRQRARAAARPGRHARDRAALAARRAPEARVPPRLTSREARRELAGEAGRRERAAAGEAAHAQRGDAVEQPPR